LYQSNNKNKKRGENIKVREFTKDGYFVYKEIDLKDVKKDSNIKIINKANEKKVLKSNNTNKNNFFGFLKEEDVLKQLGKKDEKKEIKREELKKEIKKKEKKMKKKIEENEENEESFIFNNNELLGKKFI
jgi:hypothetical protein